MALFDRNHSKGTLLPHVHLPAKLKPGSHIFPNCFSFHTIKRSDEIARANHLKTLDNILHTSATQPGTIIVVTDASTKRGLHAVSVAHGWRNKSLVFNSEHYCCQRFVRSRNVCHKKRHQQSHCPGRNQPDNCNNGFYSVCPDTSNHSLQGHTIAMSHSSSAKTNSIQFWGCPSDDR